MLRDGLIFGMTLCTSFLHQKHQTINFKLMKKIKMCLNHLMHEEENHEPKQHLYQFWAPHQLME
jgi:hypothetical protein